MINIPEKKVKEMFKALDNFLGDTDPFFDDDITDEEIRNEEPVFWVAKELSKYLNEEKNHG